MNRAAEVLFHELADLSRAQRDSYYAERQVPAEVRAEVEELLRFDTGADHSLTECVADSAEEVLRTTVELKEDRYCGPYRLVRLLGRGGAGAVFLGERTDGEVEQRVAIKLLRYGSDDPAFRDRFLRERQILASLSHAGIARLIDAGHTADGQPYLVMDYIDGTPIDVYAEKLDLRGKLTLFLRVCEAVSYAHRNLVIHRDIKPSNILVDSSAEPKLLDFGIARLLEEQADRTQTRDRLLTPDYASPEQVRGMAQTTATDIYSLGAVLYKLLTGRSPHGFASESREAIETAICSQEPPPASRLNPNVPRDLDFVLAKALRKEADERYPSVDTLADDLRAFLEWRPVRARSGNAWYRTRKFLRRYWVPVAAAALVIASLSAGLYVANRQRVIAERRFTQLRELARQVLFELDPELGALPGSINARRKLVATSTQYLAGLGAEALHDKELAREVAQSYMQVARIQGVRAWTNLGQYAEAEESLRKADMFLDSVLVADPNNRSALWLSANVAHDRASAANADRRPEQVIAGASKARERFDQLVRLGNLTRKEINGATYIYGDLAGHHIGLHRFEDGVRYARAGIEISRTNATVSGPRAQVFSMLAGALTYLGDFQGALEAIQEARNHLEKLRHDGGDARYNRTMLALVRLQEGLTLGEDGGVSLNRPMEAASVFREAFDALEESAKKEPKDYHTRDALAELGRHLGDVLRHSDPSRALEVYDHTLMRIREVPNDVAARRQEASLLAGSSYAARWLHRESDARDRIDGAFRLLRETKDYPTETIKPGSEADAAVRALADHCAETGETNKAIEAYQELHRKLMASNPDPQNDLLNAAHISRLDASLAALLRRVGRGDEAVTLEENRRGLWRLWDRKLPNNSFVLRQLAASRPN